MTLVIMTLEFLCFQFPYVLTVCSAKSRQGTKYIDDDSFEKCFKRERIILRSKIEKYDI